MYEQSKTIPKIVYHYTKKENIEAIMESRSIKCFSESVCWFSLTKQNLIDFMKLTVMKAGALYINSQGELSSYPDFKAEEYVILELKPKLEKKNRWFYWIEEADFIDYEDYQKAQRVSRLKIAHRGDLDFKKITIYDVLDFKNN